jgi:hypothetical protein
MGEYYETIADVEATEAEAESLAATTLAWLVETGFVLAGPTDCVLSEAGYPPGPRYATAVVEDDPRLLRLRTNGVAIITGRTVFYSMGSGEVSCPHCRHVMALTGDAWDELSDTIGIWFDGGDGGHPCPSCDRVVDLNDWAWSPPWGFGYFGLKFWNWPPLSPRFLAEVSERLGHRIVTPRGKV